MYEKDRLVNEYKEFFKDVSLSIPNPINYTLTVKQFEFNRRTTVDDIRRNNRHFFNRLTRSIFGHNRQKRYLKRAVIISVSRVEGIHVHLVIEKPEHIKLRKFIDLIEFCWGKTSYANYQSHFEIPEEELRKIKWANYLKKNKNFNIKEILEGDNTKGEVDWENTYLTR